VGREKRGASLNKGHVTVPDTRSHDCCACCGCVSHCQLPLSQRTCVLTQDGAFSTRTLCLVCCMMFVSVCKSKSQKRE